ncbi:MAG: hypothetical protein R2827_13930 [Bdellovibrionales bacterium]
MKLLFKKRKGLSTQLELDVQRKREPDRNHYHGGRSFYFFDFDDNIAYLTTPIWIFHKKTGNPIKLSSGEYAHFKNAVGRYGKYADYEFNYGPQGSFKSFRDKNLRFYNRMLGEKQDFVLDVKDVLSYPDFDWKGPSWNTFYHAVYNRRPLSLITARGHKPETIVKGISQFVKKGFLPNEPNYLSIFPVNCESTQLDLTGQFNEGANISKLKQMAIRKSVEQAIQQYGENPYHRFGMSDDDPDNIKMIIEEMARLKQELPENSFFVISTHGGALVKTEIFTDHTVDVCLSERAEQLSLL